MAVLLVGIAVMGVLMAAALPAWRTMMKREKEAELIFRGEQYARAIGLFQRKFAGAFPPSIDVLVEQKFLRRKYKDPMTPDGEFQVLYQAVPVPQPGAGAPGSRPGVGGPGAVTPGAQPAPAQPGAQPTGVTGIRGGVIGVVSKSKEKAIRLYKGRDRYNEWHFVYTAVSQGIGAPGSTTPGMVPGGPRQPTGPAGPGGRMTFPGGPQPMGPGQPPRPGMPGPVRPPGRPPG
jgi:type II secretory pathway pseudopilin PulG